MTIYKHNIFILSFSNKHSGLQSCDLVFQIEPSVDEAFSKFCFHEHSISLHSRIENLHTIQYLKNKTEALLVNIDKAR